MNKFKRILSWFFTIFIAVFAIASIDMQGFVMGLPFIIMLFFVAPPLINLLEKITGRKLATKHKAIGIVSSFMLIGLIVGVKDVKEVLNRVDKKEELKQALYKSVGKEQIFTNVEYLYKIVQFNDNDRGYSAWDFRDEEIEISYDSMTGKLTVYYSPKYSSKYYDDLYMKGILNKHDKYGDILDYDLVFVGDTNLNFTEVQGVLIYSLDGKSRDTALLSANAELNLARLENKDRIAELERARAIKEQAKANKDNKEKFEKECLNGWDGSSYELKEYVKKNMHDPSSFEHVETRYRIDGEYATVIMSYRGKNRIGATVLEAVEAKVKVSDCSLVSVN